MNLEGAILFAKEIENRDQIMNRFIGHADIGGIASIQCRRITFLNSFGN